MGISAERSSVIACPDASFALPQQNGSIKDHTINFTGHAHIDFWTWDWLETYGAVETSWRSAVKSLQEFPDMHFAASQAEHYKYIKEESPKLWEKVQELIAKRKWELVGGTVVEEDCHVPLGEQRVRQLLYGQHFFYDNFGEITSIGYKPDAFGTDDDVQINAKSGIRLIARMRPEEMEEGNDPHDADMARWVSIDGSEVVDYHLAYDYNAAAGKLHGHISIPPAIWHPYPKDRQELFGTGNHGGEFNEKQLAILYEAQKDPQLPTIRHGRWDEFLERIAETIPHLPERRGPIENHAPGCWSTEMRHKMLNRKAGWMQPAAEVMSMMALQATGRRYRLGEFHDAGWNIAVTQFHDLLGGTATKREYDTFVYPLLEGSLGILNKEAGMSLLAIAKEIQLNPEENEKPVVLANTHSWDVKGVAEIELYDPEKHINPSPDTVFHARTSTGEEIPLQEVVSGAGVQWQKRYALWTEVPSQGHDVIYIAPGRGEKEFPQMEATDTHMENENYSLTVDPETGYFRLFDKKNLFDVFKGDAGIPKVHEDTSDTWGHGMHLDQLAGQFKATKVTLAENGPVYSVIQIDGKYEGSTMTQYITMYNNSNRIDISYVTNWQEQEKALKIHFPVNLIHTKAKFEGPYTVTKRRQSPQDVVPEEVSMHNWFDLTGESNRNGKDQRLPYGVSFMTDGVSSVSVASPADGRPKVGITVLRSPLYAKHHPDKLPHEKQSKDRPENYQNQGVLQYKISILPHENGWEDAKTPQQAAELNMPLQALVHDTIQPDGTLPEWDSYLQVESIKGNVIVPVMKLAEDGSGDMIIRPYNTTKVPSEAIIRLPHWQGGRDIRIALKAHEFMTIRVPRNPEDPCSEVIIPEMIEYKKESNPTQHNSNGSNGKVRNTRLMSK